MPNLVQATPFPGAALPTIPALDVEAAFTSAPGDGPSYRSIATGIFRSLHTRRGRAHELGKIPPGTFDAEISNRNQWFNPDNSNSPLYGLVKPNKRFRAQLTWSGTRYDLIAGHLDGWPQQTRDGLDQYVALSGQDFLRWLARNDLPSSMYDMAVATDQPSHWWTLADPLDAASPTDTGYAASPFPGVPADATFGVDGIVPFAGDATAATLDGWTGRIAAPGAAPTNATWSIECWYSIPTLTVVGGSQPVILFVNPSNAPAVGPFPSLSAVLQTGSFIGCLQVTLTTGVGGLSTSVTLTTGRTDDGGPHHLVVTWNGTTMSVYQDSVLVGTGSPGGGATAFAANTTLEMGGTSSSFFIAVSDAGVSRTVQHFATYDGQVLTATQVANHYNAGETAFAGDDTIARLRRVADYLGIPAADRSFGTGNSLLGAYDLDGPNALEYFQDLASTEAAQWYAAKNGQLTPRRRHDALTATRSVTSQVTFNDQSTTYPFVGVELAEELVRNPVTVQRSGGAPQTVIDLVARERNGPNAWSLDGTLLYANDNDALSAAAWYLSHYKDPAQRISSITICPQMAPATLWPAVLTLELGDRITVVRHPPGGSSTFSQEYIVEGIEHDYDRDNPWTVTLRLSPAETLRYWILGDATWGVLGSTTRIAF